MMYKKSKLLLSFLLFATVLFWGCGGNDRTASAQSKPSETEAAELSVSAAASLTDAMTEIGVLFEETHPDLTITYSFASSGTLQKQIEEGADVDLFVSAGKKQMDALASKELLVSDSVIDLLENKIVLIVPNDTKTPVTSFEECMTERVSMIAVGEPESVPVGLYAKEIFTYLNGWDTIREKANFGTDVKQVLSWVESGNADCGVVYSTDAAISGNVSVAAEAPAGSHSPVIYPAAMIKTSEKQAEAGEFLLFLRSDEASQIFIKYGFHMYKQ